MFIYQNYIVVVFVGNMLTTGKIIIFKSPAIKSFMGVVVIIEPPDSPRTPITYTQHGVVISLPIYF